MTVSDFAPTARARSAKGLRNRRRRVVRRRQLDQQQQQEASRVFRSASAARSHAGRARQRDDWERTGVAEPAFTVHLSAVP